jgi:hypothetical protein
MFPEDLSDSLRRVAAILEYESLQGFSGIHHRRVLDRRIDSMGDDMVRTTHTITRKPDVGDIVLRQYVLAPPLDWDDDCERELRSQNELWNKLVEIERAHRESVIGLTADDPVVQAAEAVIKEARDEFDALKKERARRRRANRKKGDTDDLDAAIRAGRDHVTRCGEAARKARRTARDTLRPKIEAANAARFAAVKAARNASGLWWCNYNAVCASYEHGRNAALKRSGELHFRRYDGEGRITNQIQGGITVADLLAGALSQVHLRDAAPSEWPSAPNYDTRTEPPNNPSRRDRQVRRMILSATVFTRGRVRKNVRWPIFLNRPIPDDAVIKEVVIHRRKVASHTRWTATFTCRRPAAPAASPRADGHRIVAVDLGWRRLNSGMRVATFMDHAGQRDFVVLPDKLLDAYDWLDDQAKHRDALHRGIVTQLRGRPWQSAPATFAAVVQWWRAIPADRLRPRHTTRLIVAWRAYPEWRKLLSYTKRADGLLKSCTSENPKAAAAALRPPNFVASTETLMP